jgi:hypothetical protein
MTISLQRILIVFILIALSPVYYGACSAGDFIAAPTPLDSFKVDLYGKRVWLTAKVNDTELLFQFDSAAGSSLLTPRAAERVGLRPDAWGSAGGAGDNTIRIQVARGVTLRLGRVSWIAPTVVLIPLDNIDEGTGRRADGLIGKDFLDRFVVEIDYQTGTMNLYDPAKYVYSGTGTSLPITLAEGPIINAKITMPGRGVMPCRLLVDAPFTGTLSFTRPFVEKYRLIDAATALTPNLLKSRIGGIGGESVTYIGRVQSLTLGPHSFDRPVAEFCLAEGGTLARSDIEGLLGAEILRRFRVIFDYPHSRMILEPAATLKDPFEHDMSGLEIRAIAPELKVFAVRRVHEGSPAAQAGVHVGDRLIMLNGRPAQQLTLPEIREMLRLPGREIRMSVKRADEDKEIVFTLRRLI